jgi:hypothetical protein
MKNFILAFITASLLFLPGCGNLSPRQEQEIDNQNGKIGEIENLANSLKAEVGKLQNQAEITDSELDRLQQGLANFQSTNDNSGVQILSGPGGIIVSLLGILSVSVLAMHWRSQSKQNEKTADILAERIVSREDPELEDEVFQAAMYTDVEENVLNLIKKHRGEV